jgi:hypothetical protein
MLIIGLGHKARQGKNVVAQELYNTAKDSGANVKMYALADELKTYCRDNHEALFAQYPHVGTKHKDDPIYGYVEMLQHYGTNVVREQNPNHWVEVLDARIKSEAPDVAIVTDVRFPNEAKWVQDSGGALIKVVRVMADGTNFVDPNRDANHPSETALNDFDNWDFIVMAANGDVEALCHVSKELWKMITDEDASKVAIVPDLEASGPFDEDVQHL